MIEFLDGGNLEWWHWAVLGLVLVMSELLLPMFVLVWFGLSGILVSLALLVAPDMGMSAQILLWTASSLLLVFLWFKVFRRSYHKVLTGRASASIIGEVGMLTQPVAPFKQGKVRFQKPVVGSDTWDCVADEEIESGARVKVTKVEGNLLTVSKPR